MATYGQQLHYITARTGYNMNSSFTTNYIKCLAISPALPEQSEAHPTPKKQNLQSLVVSLKQPLSRSETRDTLHSFEQLERDAAVSAVQPDREEYALKRVIIGEIAIGLYAEALDTYLTEASEVEAEAEWWADIERSRRNVAYYFLQSAYWAITLHLAPYFAMPIILSC
jgi:nuclear-control-of-ATPase protein 2